MGQGVTPVHEGPPALGKPPREERHVHVGHPELPGGSGHDPAVVGDGSVHAHQMAVLVVLPLGGGGEEDDAGAVAPGQLDHGGQVGVVALRGDAGHLGNGPDGVLELPPQDELAHRPVDPTLAEHVLHPMSEVVAVKEFLVSVDRGPVVVDPVAEDHDVGGQVLQDLPQPDQTLFAAVAVGGGVEDGDVLQSRPHAEPLLQDRRIGLVVVHPEADGDRVAQTEDDGPLVRLRHLAASKTPRVRGDVPGPPTAQGLHQILVCAKAPKQGFVLSLPVGEAHSQRLDELPALGRVHHHLAVRQVQQVEDQLAHAEEHDGGGDAQSEIAQPVRQPHGRQ